MRADMLAPFFNHARMVTNPAAFRRTPFETTERAHRRFSRFAAVAAGYTYLLMVWGGIVRITGSGLGCGSDWPRCHGSWIPPMDLTTLIEYTHRMLAAGIIIPVAIVVFYAMRHRAEAGFSGPGGLLRPVGLFLALLVVQIGLGAATVKMDLPPAVTVLHFVTASCILATLLVAAVRGRHGGSLKPPQDTAWSTAALAAGLLGLTTLALGSLTANTGAAPACQGFPLCNGSVLPGGGSLVAIQWTHRLAAFTLAAYLFIALLVAAQRSTPQAVRSAVATAAGLVILQLAVAAVMILRHLPESVRIAHLAVGLALWCALVVWAAQARRSAAPAASMLAATVAPHVRTDA
jgi:heme A synthase